MYYIKYTSFQVCNSTKQEVYQIIVRNNQCNNSLLVKYIFESGHNGERWMQGQMWRWMWRQLWKKMQGQMQKINVETIANGKSSKIL